MARILISAFSNVSWTEESYNDSFVQGFINTLIRSGNDVLNINCLRIVDNLLNPECKNSQIKEFLLKKLNNFNPELIIVFNNMLPDVFFIEKTKCPIILYVADGCDFLANRSLIKKYQHRYWFFNLNKSIYDSLKANFSFIKKERFIDFGYATDFRRRKMLQDINVSFLGTIPNWTDDLTDYFLKHPSNQLKNDFFKKFDKFRSNVFESFETPLMKLKSKYSFETFSIWLLTAKERFEILSTLSKLGLKIYGYEGFCDCGRYDYEILRAYDFDLCVTQDQAEMLFNRSKISLNLPNARATCGFSWRVPDILASSSVLLCNKKSDLIDLMAGYAQLPMYESSQEAKEIALKLLSDDKWRKDLSLASNKMIEDKCRFELKFKNIEEILNLKLFNDSKGSYIDINFQHFNLKNDSFCCNKKTLQDKIEYKIWKKLDKKLRKKRIIK